MSTDLHLHSYSLIVVGAMKNAASHSSVSWCRRRRLCALHSTIATRETGRLRKLLRILIWRRQTPLTFICSLMPRCRLLRGQKKKKLLNKSDSTTRQHLGISDPTLSIPSSVRKSAWSSRRKPKCLTLSGKTRGTELNKQRRPTKASATMEKRELPVPGRYDLWHGDMSFERARKLHQKG